MALAATDNLAQLMLGHLQLGGREVKDLALCHNAGDIRGAEAALTAATVSGVMENNFIGVGDRAQSVAGMTGLPAAGPSGWLRESGLFA
jgi:hypothetical protein